MAHTTEDSNLVWQKVRIAAETLGLHPEIVNQLRDLKQVLATVRGNVNLKFTPISATTNGSDGGNAATVISDTANTALVALVLKKSTGSTLAYNTISNHGSAVQAQKEVLLAATTAGRQIAAFYPKGLAFATGITFGTVTAYNGSTQSLKVDSADGFAISIDAALV